MNYVSPFIAIFSSELQSKDREKVKVGNEKFVFQVDFVDSVPACFETIFYSYYEILS